MPGFRLLAGLGVAGGLAAGAAARPPAAPPGRAAVLLAPRPTVPGQGPAVARAAPGDGPAWLNPGAGVVQTGATSWGRSAAEVGNRPASVERRPVPAPIPVPAASHEPSLLTQGVTKLKGLTGDRTQQPVPAGPAAAAQPQVFAGPPAWRWYGYGSVTPGANALAPTGQYPRASANWYHVTGATPGAFPVPVVNPYRSAPSGEPPAYAQTPAGYRGPGIAGPAMAGPVMVPTTPRVAAPEPVRVTPPVPVRTVAGVPTLAPPPGLGAELPVVPAKGPEPLAALPTARPTDPEPPVAVNPVPLPAEPTSPVSTPVPAPPTPPADEVRWQPGSAKPTLPPAENWAPASPGAMHATRPPVARGQVPDADPVADLVRGVCRGRAEAVEVRRLGPTALAVGFDVRTAAEAKGLVDDISRRPELGPYRIDFAARVK